MKKWIKGLMAGLLVFSMASSAGAASSIGKPSTGSTGLHSSHSVTGTTQSSHNVNSTGAQRPSNSVTNTETTGTTDPSSKTYNSGPQKPSSSVTQQPSPATSSQPAPTTSNVPSSVPKSSGIGSFLGGMAVGGLVGSMFHPFGGSMHTMGSTAGFSFTGLIFDILIIAAIVWIIRKFLRRA